MSIYEDSRLQKRDYVPGKCDKYDYLIAVSCGAIAGLVDIFFVGSPIDSTLQGWTDSQVDNAVCRFAHMCGWSPRDGKEESVASAIGFLEKKFPVNYDHRHTVDVGGAFQMSAKNHHMKSLAHSPDVVGLFFSILNQFTSTSTFLSDGQIITIDTESFELQGSNPMSKLFCGFTNWLGHIMSDVAGSSGAQGRGSGVVIPFYELLQLCDFGSFQVGQYKNTLATVATKAFQEGYDARFGMTMAIPVLLSDLMIRLFWALKRHFYQGKPLAECVPSKKYADLRCMILVGNATLCLMDGMDAFVRSGGDALRFFMRLNLIAWFRLVMLVLKEVMIRYGFNYADLANEFNRLNDEIDRYLVILRSIDYEEYQKELEEIHRINELCQINGDHATNLLYNYFNEHGIELQFQNFEEFDQNNQDPDFVLVL